MADQDRLVSEILDSLKDRASLSTSDTFASYDTNDVKSALDRLASRSFVIYETNSREEAQLEKEGNEIVSQNASHEARVWAALSEAVGGLSMKDLESKVGGKDVLKVGQMRAFKANWIAKGEQGRLVAAVSHNLSG